MLYVISRRYFLMKTKIDITSIDPEYTKTVASKLEEKGVPACLGNMILPALPNMHSLEMEDYFSDANFTEDKEIYSTNIRGLLTSNHELMIGKCLTVSGKNAISAYKTELIDAYVVQAIKCTKCKYTDVCFKLTQTMLQFMQLANGENTK